MSQAQNSSNPARFAGETKITLGLKLNTNPLTALVSLLTSRLQSSSASLVVEDLPSNLVRMASAPKATNGELELTAYPSDELLNYVADIVGELDKNHQPTVATSPSPLAPAQFAILDSGDMVRDERTGLIWSRAVSPSAMNWKAATEYAASLRTGGHSDWRLPTRAELLSIIDDTRCNPAIDTDAFPETPSRWHWSSSPYAGSSDCAWGVYFYYGNSVADYRDSDGFVRAVRGRVSASQ